MPNYEIINTIAQWFVLAIWFLGAVVMLGGAIYLAQSMAWVIYRRFKGWNNIPLEDLYDQVGEQVLDNTKLRNQQQL